MPTPSGPRSGSTGTTYSWRPCTNAVVHAPWTCQSRILTPPPPRARAARPLRARPAPARRPGVADDDRLRAGDYTGELGEGRSAAEVECTGAGDLSGQRDLVRSSGDHHAPPGRDERVHQLR